MTADEREDCGYLASMLRAAVVTGNERALKAIMSNNFNTIIAALEEVERAGMEAANAHS
jgi:hypothetical protein